jgi:hypothetical protein
VRLLSVPRVTDLGGETVRQSVLVSELGPKLKSISQLMFFDGERNSVPVDDCGIRVPVVWDVLDVVLAGVVVGVVGAVVVGAVVVVVVVVDDELCPDGLLEQAASARAQAGRINNRTDRSRSARTTAEA